MTTGVPYGSRTDTPHCTSHAWRSVRASNCRTRPFLHLFVAQGEVTLEGAGPLTTGDAVRFSGTGGHRVEATEAAELLLWEMHADLR